MSNIQVKKVERSMSEQLNARQVGIIVVFLGLTYLAHTLGQVVQIGGAQLAPSIVVYALLALLMAPRLGWAALAVIAVVIGLLTMLATSSPYPLANLFAHPGGFLFAAYLGKRWAASHKELGAGALAVAFTLTTSISWTVFASVTWLGLSGTEFAATNWTRFGIAFGTGFGSWWLYGLLGVGIPSLAVGLVLSPALARLFRRDVGATSQGQRGLPR